LRIFKALTILKDRTKWFSLGSHFRRRILIGKEAVHDSKVEGKLRFLLALYLLQIVPQSALNAL
jgi:hypothetical protein